MFPATFRIFTCMMFLFASFSAMAQQLSSSLTLEKCPTPVATSGHAEFPLKVQLSITPPQPQAMTVALGRAAGYEYSVEGVTGPVTTVTIKPNELPPSLMVGTPSGVSPGVLELNLKILDIILPKECELKPLTYVLNAGLGKVASLQIDSEDVKCDKNCDDTYPEYKFMKPLQLNNEESFEVSLIKKNGGGSLFNVPAPVAVVLRGKNACLNVTGNVDANKCHAESSFDGVLSRRTFYMIPTHDNDSENGSIDVEIKSSADGPTMLAAKVKFTIAPSAWKNFLMTLLGAMIYAAIDLTLAAKGRVDEMWTQLGTNKGASFVLAAAAALVGWAMKATSFVDLKISANDSLGYVAMGFILAMMGIESLMKRLQNIHSQNP